MDGKKEGRWIIDSKSYGESGAILSSADDMNGRSESRCRAVACNNWD